MKLLEFIPFPKEGGEIPREVVDAKRKGINGNKRVWLVGFDYF
jgi:hypothetical protein